MRQIARRHEEQVALFLVNAYLSALDGCIERDEGHMAPLTTWFDRLIELIPDSLLSLYEDGYFRVTAPARKRMISIADSYIKAVIITKIKAGEYTREQVKACLPR